MNDTETIAALFVRTRGTVPDHFHSTASAAAFHPPPYTRNRTNNRVYKVPQREEKRVQVRERDPPARQLAPAF